ncbi:MAG: phosphotransferase [Candidatus Uhrbacteria bacterium]
MDTNSFLQICQIYNLGKLVEEAETIEGGLIHKMWRLKTNNGKYAIKELNSEIINKPNALELFELSEAIARQLNGKKIPAVTGLLVQGKAVQKISNSFVIVYPWIEGKILSTDAASPEQAFLIGKTIGEIHRINLDELQLQNSPPNFFSNKHWQTLINNFKKTFPKKAFNFEKITQWNNDAEQFTKKLQLNWVISHGDIDQKNVIWKNNNEPWIIDWEGVSKTNPGLEIVDAALNWGGLVAGEIDENSLKAVIKGYKDSGRLIKESVPDLLNGSVIKWLAWLEFNLQRALKSPDDSLVMNQVENTFRNLDLISENFERLTSLIDL